MLFFVGIDGWLKEGKKKWTVCLYLSAWWVNGHFNLHSYRLVHVLLTLDKKHLSKCIIWTGNLCSSMAILSVTFLLSTSGPNNYLILPLIVNWEKQKIDVPYTNIPPLLLSLCPGNAEQKLRKEKIWYGAFFSQPSIYMADTQFNSCMLQLSWFLNSHHRNLLLCCFQIYYSLHDFSFRRGGCAFVPLEEVGRGVVHRNRGAEGSLGRKGLMCWCKFSEHWAIQKNSANQMYSMIVSSFSDTGDGRRCPSFLVLVVTNSSSNTSMRCVFRVLSVLHARSMLTGHLWGQCFPYSHFSR